MENNPNLKKIDGLIYRLSLSDTFKSLQIGQEIRLSNKIANYSVARSSCRWIQLKDKEYNFSVLALDRLQSEYLVKRIPAK